MNGKMQNLSGETIISAEGNKYKLGRLAGYGAQGVVYETANGSMMIKLYYPTGSEVIDSDILERLSFIKNVKVPPNFVIHSRDYRETLCWVCDGSSGRPSPA